MYSQNEEEKYILESFKDKRCETILDIGANDGQTFSNSLALIEKGCVAYLIEPSIIAFSKLKEKYYKDFPNVHLFNIAISDKTEQKTFYESGQHITSNDVALLSSLDKKETEKWKNTDFNTITVNAFTYKDFLKDNFTENPIFDFITIDAEGYDLIILKQIDLTNTQMLCIEWNMNEGTKKEIMEYCAKFEMTNLLYQSNENLIITK